MRRIALVGALIAIVATGAPVTAQRGRRSSHVAQIAPVRPRPENQFLTVDEYRKSHRAPGTAVSVEGYVVTASKGSDGSVRAAITDSVDKVLTATEAAKLAAASARITIPARLAARTGLSWAPKGFQRIVMYSGSRCLHDAPKKIRVTGLTAKGGAVAPAARVEFEDDNGNWKAM